MALAIEQFVQGLEQSGLVSPRDLRAVRQKLLPDRQHDAQELARELVRQKLLTTYQVKEAFQGNAKDLILGNYTILDQIGQGGMGQVFKAQHRKMKRLVAIKLLPAAMTKDQAAINRFQREVEAAAKLRHPNIVAADDADEAAGRHFLVMEYVEGQDLSALVKKTGPLPIAKAINNVLQVARGLEFAHGEGVVHRDIKPANLLLDKKGVVKILDMGLARLESAAGVEDAELTGTGQIMGTVDYMAPEQALNTKHADQRADIYSLGITLWYLLTGRAAFGGDTVMEKLLAHREQPIPSLQAACPGATPDLEAVFTKMVAKKTDDRFQSMSEVVAELERFHSGPISAAQPAARDTAQPAARDTAQPAARDTAQPAARDTAQPAARDTAQPAARNSGSIHDDHDNEHRLGEFSGGAKASSAASGQPSGKPAAAMKRAPSTVLDATVTMAGQQIETDPKTEQSLIVPSAGSAWWKKGRIPGARPRLLVACAAGAIALLLVGVVIYREAIKAPLPAIAPFDAKQAEEFQEAWARRLGKEVEIENSLGMKLRLIPPGEFTMGSPQAEIDALVESTMDPNLQGWFRSEGPRHPVKLTQAFYLASCEVTQQQYQKLMGTNPSHFSLSGPGKDIVKGLEAGELPVEMVSWFDAVDFCNKLSEREQRLPYYARDGEAVTLLGGNGYRLPTEAEWEFACRAGTTTRWSFGDDEAGLAQHAWYHSNSGNRPHRIGELPASTYGLYDLYGNVWEWCWDWHGEYAIGAVSDPQGSAAGSCRVLRGGAFSNIASTVRSAPRDMIAPTSRASYSGFRVATNIDAKVKGLPAASDGPAPTKDNDPGEKSINPPESANAPFDTKQAVAHQEAWAKHLGIRVEIESSLGMKLRLIPPGEFTMGSPQAEIDALVQSTAEPQWQGWFRSEGPQHRVKLTQAFYLGSCEVTQRQYKELMGANPSHFSLGGEGNDAVKDLDTSQHAVDSVTWFDAIDFCNQLSELEKRSPYYKRDGEAVAILGGNGYRLPTEAEWEYACRAGTTTRWSFGDTERDLGQHAWFESNANGRTQRVGDLPANPFGLFDLYGNVWEWCWDWHGEYAAGATSDPSGSAAGALRILRGGAFNNSPSFVRSAYRDPIHPTIRFPNHGFRVARTIDAKREPSPTAATGRSTAPPDETDPDETRVEPPIPAIAPFDAKQPRPIKQPWQSIWARRSRFRTRWA